MEIRNLNTFLQVAALQSFTNAGNVLGYSQSNISAQIKQLEQELGSPLFDRIGRNVSLTSYGEALIPYAHQIVSASLEIENHLKSEDALGGTVRIGMVDSLFELLSNDTFLHYHQRFPKVNLELSVDANATLKERLLCNLLDIACLIDEPLLPTEWMIWDSVYVPIVIVANPAHPLTHQEVIQLKQLDNQEMVLVEDSAPYSVRFQRMLAGQKVAFRPFLKTQSTATACQLVEQARFLSVLPLYSVRQSVRTGQLRILNVPDWNETMMVQLVAHPNKIMTPQMKGFLEELRTPWEL